ncbi:MAG: M20/M25/M40 family metallo-hydrolase [Micrococcaceae bacterium]|nr:M20/M25/M40 family metallo-hydrolase [Micrococcaceae bacterium]
MIAHTSSDPSMMPHVAGEQHPTREERVLNRIHRPDLVDLTTRLVAAASENPGGTEHATVQELEKALRSIGAEVHLSEVAPGRPNLVAHLGDTSDTPGILFLGHSDVVPAGPGWAHDPFAPYQEGDLLYGRGSTDMKGGLAAVVTAMAAVHAEAPETSMTLVCTVDEEADALGIEHYIMQPPQRRYAACVVAEPTDLVTIVGCRGAANLEITVTGASAHAGRPADGASAILGAGELIKAVETDSARLATDPHPVLGAATWNIGTISGGHGTSIVPDTCHLAMDRRLLPGEEPERILDRLLTEVRASARDARRAETGLIVFEGQVTMQMPGFLTDPDSDFPSLVTRTLRDLDVQRGTGIWTASCEGGFIAEHHGVPTVVLGPGDINGQAHQPNENVSINDLHAAARAYALIALRASAAARVGSPGVGTPGGKLG